MELTEQGMTFMLSLVFCDGTNGNLHSNMILLRMDKSPLCYIFTVDLTSVADRLNEPIVHFTYF